MTARGRLSTMGKHSQQRSAALPAPEPGGSGDPPGKAADFGAALAELAATITRQGASADDDTQALTVIAEGAVAAIAGAPHSALVVLGRSGQLESVACHGDVPGQILALQNEIGQGPTLDAV